MLNIYSEQNLLQDHLRKHDLPTTLTEAVVGLMFKGNQDLSIT